MSAPLLAEVTTDGNATTEELYTTLGSTQTEPSNVGQGNVLASMRYVAEANTLNLAITGRATNHAMILFIDAKPGGVTRITPNLIATQQGGEHEFINKLALSETEGLTFEDGFEPEIAIRIFGSEVTGVKYAYVNRFNLITGNHVYVGDAHAGVLAEGPIRAIKADWVNVTNSATHRRGVEMSLNLTALGVVGINQSMKLSAILVSKMNQDDPESPTYMEGTNQTLGPLDVGSDMTESLAIHNFEDEPGTQTLEVTVSGLNPLLDEDSDGLLNGVETNTGTYVNQNDTGTDPEVPDNDGDGYLDGLEVNGSSALGYVSNPLVANYTNMAVPGSFNQPVEWQANSAVNNPSTAMVQESTSLTGQYRWNLNYKFPPSKLGAFGYKFTTGGNFTIQWGGGPTQGIAQTGLGANNIPGTVTASGMHKFSLNQVSLAYSFERLVFPDVTAFLAAYQLSAGSDADGDGIPNEGEFPENTDPTATDTDGDGFSDFNDGIPLNASMQILPYSVWSANLPSGDQDRSDDPDKDGFSNLEEYLFGTPPASVSGSLSTIQNSGGNLVIRWNQRKASATYRLEESSSLSSGPWPLSTATIGNDANQSGIPTGYIRKSATVPINQGGKFLRIKGEE
jgi:hypothetical protein